MTFFAWVRQNNHPNIAPSVLTEKIMIKTKPLLLLVVFFLQTFLGHGQDISTEDLYDMSLEELMSLEVVTASKTQEGQSSAPAVMTIVTRQEIEAYGAINLTDVLDRVVNFYVTGSYLIPSNNVNIRGKHTGLYDTHVLWLLNGRPLRESIHAGVNSAILNMFPLASIRRIEVIRGPGSVLYGTSAFQGVINIITEEAKDPVELSAAVRRGSFGVMQSEVALRSKLNEDADVSIGFMQYGDEGWEATATFENDQTITTNLFERGYGTVLNANYKRWTLNGFYGYDQQRQWGRSFSSWKGDLAYENKRGFLGLGYDLAVADNFSTDINVGYNFTNHNYIFLDRFADRGDYRYAHDVLLEVTNHWQASQRLNVVFGGSAMSLNGEALRPELNVDRTPFPIDSAANPNPYVNIPSYSEVWYNGYIQADYTWDIFKFVIGGQANKVARVAWDFVPRLGLVTNFNRQLYAKLLYAEAFRSGSFFERNATSLPSVLGNPSLRPETINTLEAQFGYQTSDMSLAVTYYRSQENDLIGRSVPADSLAVIDYQGRLISVPQYINKGMAKFSGIELEGKKYFNRHFAVNVAASYQSSEDNDGRKNYLGLPQLMIKTGFNFKNNRGMSLGIFNSYFGEGGDVAILNEDGESTTRNLNGEVTAYHYLSANLNVNIFKVLKKDYDTRLIFNVYGTNLLNADIFYPEVQRKRANSLPGRPGRAVYAGVKLEL